MPLRRRLKKTEDEVFAEIAPSDKVLNDPNKYDTKAAGTINLASIDEDSSVMRHTIKLGEKTLPYVARAGHLIAYEAPTTGQVKAKYAKAAIFYTSYTRDGLPKENRPVTFLWNGGPGSASIWLHLGSWGPKRLKSDAPKTGDGTKQAASFPFEDNAISLLDQTDIVFVDPPGTGLSTAISPFINSELWGTDADAQIVADFITSYTNKYGRQSSPKYLYGESYGGIRTPIVANLLEQAGTASYAVDPSGKPAQVLAGIILNSPLVDYNSNCNMNSLVSCEGYFPAYAMTADYYKRSTKRAGRSQADYMEELRKFAREKVGKTIDEHGEINLGSSWSDYGYRLRTNSDFNAFVATAAGASILSEVSDYTGIPVARLTTRFNYDPDYFPREWMPNNYLGRYDARMHAPTGGVSPDGYIDAAFANQLKDYFPSFVNYRNTSDYQALNNDTIKKWKWPHAGKPGQPQSVTDLQAVLNADPKIKMMILHGYEDIATPGFQTELDLEAVNLKTRIPIKWFEGGHMIYNTESSRDPLKATMNDYYGSPAKDAAGVPILDAAVLAAMQ